MAVNKHLSVLQAEVQQQSDNLSKALSEKALLEVCARMSQFFYTPAACK